MTGDNEKGANSALFIGIVGLGFLLLLPILFSLPGAYFESQTFNRLTGANTTYFDALWVELRVDCQNLRK